MKKRMRLSLFTILTLTSTMTLSSEVTGDFNGKWAGIEVMGTDKKTAQLIREIVPIKKGDSFSSSDSEKHKRWCDKIKAEVKRDEVDCGFMGYPGREFYFDVQIRDKKEKNKFRVISNSLKNNIKIEKELLSLFDDFDELYWTFMPKDIFPNESFDKGYIDYDIPELHVLTAALAKLAHAHNQNLLDVIQYSSDAELRSKAATLLSWSQTPSNIEYVLNNDLLSDPSEDVRNNLLRSLSFFLIDVDDPALLKKTMNAFCKQTKLNSTTDRNKSIYSILTIIKAKPEAAGLIDNNCKKSIEQIADASILPSVGGLAKDILEILSKVDNEKNTNFN
jgi:hypothetical protein